MNETVSLMYNLHLTSSVDYLAKEVRYIGGKCHKVRTLLSFWFVIVAGIHKMLVRITNREDPDQTASSETV